MLSIIGNIIFIILYVIVVFLIHPVVGLLATVLPIAGLLYNWNKKD
jgi:ABC-type protease/lipase transport system fused ATPase/permease subunit